MAPTLRYIYSGGFASSSQRGCDMKSLLGAELQSASPARHHCAQESLTRFQNVIECRSAQQITWPTDAVPSLMSRLAPRK